MPHIRPAAMPLVPVREECWRDYPLLPFSMADLAGVRIIHVGGHWHAVWRGGGHDHQFWLREPPPPCRICFTVELPLDPFFDLRAHAVRRFLSARQGLAAGQPLRAIPNQTRLRHITRLRALDAWHTGASYRAIAERLLGYDAAEPWEMSPHKSRARRLVAEGLRYANGAYRELLHYPVRPHPFQLSL